MKLSGKTQKGRNRIAELGEEWILLERREKVLFSSELGWILIAPKFDLNKIRWIMEANDPDFQIVT